jgi:hypothetical protein
MVIRDSPRAESVYNGGTSSFGGFLMAGGTPTICRWMVHWIVYFNVYFMENPWMILGYPFLNSETFGL